MTTLTYGDLPLDEYGDADGVAAFAPLSGLDVGTPEVLTEALPRLLLDGEDVVGDRWGNRQITFLVRITGPDWSALSRGMALLEAEAQKPRNTLTLAIDEDQPASVYETFRATVTVADGDWDFFVAKPGRKHIMVQVTCAASPFPRAETEVVGNATIGAAESTTVIDACNALTGWTGRLRGMSLNTSTYLTATGSVQSQSESDGNFTSVFHPDGSVTATYYGWFEKIFAAQDVSTQQYVQVALLGYDTLLADLTLDGKDATLVSIVYESGWKRLSFRVPAGMTSFTDFKLATASSQTFPSSAYLPTRMVTLLDDVKKSNQPAGSTGRQMLLSVPVRGSARTGGSLSIQHETDALGDVLVYTAPDLADGFYPALRRFRSGGQIPSADGGAISGQREDLTTSESTSFRADVPTLSLRPDRYMVFARALRTLGSGEVTLTVRASTMFGATESLESVQTLAVKHTFNGTVRETVFVGTLDLPPTRVAAGTTALTRIGITSSAATVALDDLLIFPVSGRLTKVDCGTAAPTAGGDSNRLWIKNASLTNPIGGVWVGTKADESDARLARVSTPGQHEFTPSSTLVFVVTPNVAAPAVSFRHPPRGYLFVPAEVADV